MKISVAIISKTEKINKTILDSVSFADEILVIVDSSEKSPKISGKTKCFFRPLSNDFSKQRNFALEKAKNDWVFFIDDDEYVGTELAREIGKIESKNGHSGYLIKRTDVCFHQPLLHGETGNTKILRLANRKYGRYERPVHEVWKIKGKIGELKSPLFHIKNNLVSGFIDRMTQYSKIDAVVLTKEKKPFSFWRLVLNPKGKFIQNYYCRLGFLDGTVGLFSAYLMSIQSLTVRIFQWTKRN